MKKLNYLWHRRYGAMVNFYFSTDSVCEVVAFTDTREHITENKFLDLPVVMIGAGVLIVSDTRSLGISIVRNTQSATISKILSKKLNGATYEMEKTW